jgi:hypothetical protein
MLIAVSHTDLLCVASHMFVECCKMLELLAVANLSDMGNELSPMVQKVSAYQYLFNIDC